MSHRPVCPKDKIKTDIICMLVSAREFLSDKQNRENARHSIETRLNRGFRLALHVMLPTDDELLDIAREVFDGIIKEFEKHHGQNRS